MSDLFRREYLGEFMKPDPEYELARIAWKAYYDLAEAIERCGKTDLRDRIEHIRQSVIYPVRRWVRLSGEQWLAARDDALAMHQREFGIR